MSKQEASAPCHELLRFGAIDAKDICDVLHRNDMRRQAAGLDPLLVGIVDDEIRVRMGNGTTVVRPGDSILVRPRMTLRIYRHERGAA